MRLPFQPGMRSYRPDAFKDDQQDSCRICGEPIKFLHQEQSPQYERQRTVGLWIHSDVTGLSSSADREKHEHYGEPRSFCTWHTSDGTRYERCGRPIKYEDVVSDHLACGLHMKQLLAQNAENERIKKAQERHAQEQAIREFEKEQYRQAAQRLREAGYEYMVTHYTVDRYSFDKQVRVDVFKLAELLAPRKDDEHGQDESRDADPSIFDS